MRSITSSFFSFFPAPSRNEIFTVKTVVRRKRRYLENFYAQPWNIQHFPKYKRDSNQLQNTDSYLDYETQTMAYDENLTPLIEDLSEINSSPLSTPHFSIVDKPKETVLNFYENANMFATETEMKDQEKLPPNPLDGLIKQPNSIIESNDDRKEPEYPAVKITGEKPTFEDKESMLIADCNVDADCGINAVCFHIERTQKFCKCLPHYKGNGMFCWMF